MEYIELEQMYEAWKKVADAVESGKMQVSDSEVKSALDTLNTAITGTLNTSDAATQQAIASLLAKLDAGIDVVDADVIAELASVKAKLVAIEDKLNERVIEDGAALTKLTGSKVEVIIPREIRTDSTNYVDVEPPIWAQGALIQLVINGATGDFTDGGGARINFYSRNIIGNAQSNFYTVSTNNAGEQGNIIISVLPYTYDPETVSSWHKENVSIQAPITPFAARIGITGSFTEGQGIDCQLIVVWIGG